MAAIHTGASSSACPHPRPHSPRRSQTGADVEQGGECEGDREVLMLDIDRNSMGWQVWLTPRQTRIICDVLVGRFIPPEDFEELFKLREWFGAEVETHKRKLGAKLTGERIRDGLKRP